jgi:hypothetical protein
VSILVAYVVRCTRCGNSLTHFGSDYRAALLAAEQAGWKPDHDEVDRKLCPACYQRHLEHTVSVLRRELRDALGVSR